MGNPAGVRRDFEALEKRRLAAAKLLEKGVSPCDVARRLGVDRQSVYRWEKVLAEAGRSGLKSAGRAGRKPSLDEEQIARLKQMLLSGPEAHGYATALWTCPRVGHVIEQEFGVRFHEAHVWRLLRKIGWSAQRPTGRALERDEEKIARWKKERWPKVKKTLQPKGGRSSSSTRAG